MADKFVLREALAGVDPAKAKQIEEAWSNLESGFTQASQKASEYDRARQEWESEKGQYKSALNSFQTFFDEWNKQSDYGTVRNPQTGRFETRRESNQGADLPVAYEPDEIQAAIDARLEAFKSEILGALDKEKTAFGTEVYTNTGQMLQWERQLGAIKKFDPEADEKLITDTARSKGLRDLNDAYFLAYGRKNMERVATDAAKKAAEEAKKERDSYWKGELAKGAQIEGVGRLGSGLRRQSAESPAADVPKSRSEAEARAIQELTSRMYAPPTA